MPRGRGPLQREVRRDACRPEDTTNWCRSERRSRSTFGLANRHYRRV